MADMDSLNTRELSDSESLMAGEAVVRETGTKERGHTRRELERDAAVILHNCPCAVNFCTQNYYFSCTFAKMDDPLDTSVVGLGLPSRKCPLCNFQSPTIPLLLSHLRIVHASDPRFHVTCGINGCTVSSKSFSALYSHIYRHHPDEGVVRKSSSIGASLQPQTTLSPSVEGVSNGFSGSSDQSVYDVGK